MNQFDMNRFLQFITATTLLAIIYSCSTPQYTCETTTCTQIETGNGPEDIILDTTTTSKRIIISSADRKADNPSGEIQALNLQTDEVKTLKRTGEPDSIIFYPHGIDLYVGRTGIRYLLVISHGNTEELVLTYELKENELVYKNAFSNELFESLNDVHSDGDEGFFVTNDHRFKGNVIHCNKYDECNMLADGLAYANGLYMKGDSLLYVATTVGKRIHEIRLGDQLSSRKITRIKGADNINFHENKLIVAGHPCFLKFIRHVKKNKRKSPSRIYSVHTETEERELVYKDNGENISAASTALIFGDYLYVSQVFNPYLLKIKLD